jgi:hypothetical protein
MTRAAVTTWNNWRDVFVSETAVNLSDGKYKSRKLHTWTRQKHARNDNPGPMSLSSFVTVSGHDGSRTHLDVAVTQQVIDVIAANTIHIDDDTLNIEAIVWADGRALLVAHRSRIIGGVWLAKIDASTIPTWPRFEVRAAGKLEGAFDDKDSADGYAAELRERTGASDVTVTPERSH